MLKVHEEKHVGLHVVRFEPVLETTNILFLNFPV
jgi:hypothetical protein